MPLLAALAVLLTSYPSVPPPPIDEFEDDYVGSFSSDPTYRPLADFGFSGADLAPDMDPYVDPSLPAAEQALLREQMMGLPHAGLANFIYIDVNGGVHMNKPSIAAADLHPTQVSPGVWQNSEGEIFCLPDTVKEHDSLVQSGGSSAGAGGVPPGGGGAGEEGGTGPFRRSRTWQSFFSAAVYGTTPPSDNISPFQMPFNNPLGYTDAMFMYGGGDSGNAQTGPNAPPDTIFDVGLQFSRLRRQWDFFLNRGSHVPIRTDRLSIPCEANISISWANPKPNLISVLVIASKASPWFLTMWQIRYAVPASAQWDGTGSHAVNRRVVSIGMKKGQEGYLHDTFFIGAQWTGGQLLKKVANTIRTYKWGATTIRSIVNYPSVMHPEIWPWRVVFPHVTSYAVESVDIDCRSRIAW